MIIGWKITRKYSDLQIDDDDADNDSGRESNEENGVHSVERLREIVPRAGKLAILGNGDAETTSDWLKRPGTGV